MRLRNIPRADDAIQACEAVVAEAESQKGLWRQAFGNANPIQIEIGMGKGRFLLRMAALHPDVNYVGIERYSSVLVRAIEKYDQEKAEGLRGLANIRFLRMDAHDLDKVFAPGEADRIYLNFSDPWPKARHARRRLTSSDFLEIYGKVLSQGGGLEVKTDNRGLFEFSLREVEKARGWTLKEHTRDLHHDEAMKAGNVMTEYEEKFSAKGNPIYKMNAVRD